MAKILFFVMLVLHAGLAHAQQRNLNVGATSGGTRVALVVGNDAYTRVPALRNAKSDAQAMATALRATGFDVILRTDLDDRSLRGAVREFIGRLSGGGEAVFYFAGHGVQLGAANYLLPTNINADNEAQVRDDGLPLQRVLDDLTDSKARFSVAIIDACRDNPFPRVAGRSIGTARGLAPTSPATGQMVLFSAGTGQSALDRLGPSDRDPNGLFTRVLLKQIQQPGVPVDQVLRNVREEVVSLAKGVGHEQVPALYDQTIGRFYFRPGTAVASAAPSSVAVPVDPTANDRAFWESVKDSRNADEIRAYLEQFPKGQFAALARTRLRGLETPPPVAAPVVPAPSIASAAPSSLVAAPTQAVVDLQRVAAGTVFRDCADCPEMVVIPPGRFTMGSPDSEPGRRPEEGPLRSISIPSAYAVGKFEVTRAQYARFARETGRAASGGCFAWTGQKYEDSPQASWSNPGIPQTENDPVVCVSWEDAKAFAQWLGGKTGKNYRLLTEAEWEYAARAGTTGRRYFGENDADACRYANVADASAKSSYNFGNTFDCRDNYAATAPAGSFLPNAFGLYDMLGNAWEWTEDCWADNYTQAPTNGAASSAGNCGRRVLRGGSWDGHPRVLRAAFRVGDSVGGRGSVVGFRLARTN